MHQKWMSVSCEEVVAAPEVEEAAAVAAVTVTAAVIVDTMGAIVTAATQVVRFTCPLHTVVLTIFQLHIVIPTRWVITETETLKNALPPIQSASRIIPTDKTLQRSFLEL